METVSNSSALKDQWARYQREFDYAKDIAFAETCAVIQNLIDEVETGRPII